MEQVCPFCGYCPTCGRRWAYQPPSFPYYYPAWSEHTTTTTYPVETSSGEGADRQS